jgi:glycosyltransferase involved in cell wall biosynthesis
MNQKRQEIVCFAGCDWWYHNRGLFCPQVITRLVKTHRILFVNSLGMRIPSLRNDRNALKKIARKLYSLIRFLRKDANGMYVLSPVSLPLSSALGKKLNSHSVFLQIKIVSFLLGFREPVVYIGCLPALEVAKKMRNTRFMIYERTDLFEEMPGADKSYIAALDRDLAKTADLVLYVNKALWEEGVKQNKNSLLIGHGVDFEVFANAEESTFIPEDIVDIPKPIVGFFGEISTKTSDFTLLEHIARQLPEMSLVLVGPISADVSVLRAYKNIYFLGQKKYEEIPHYGKVFDVAIMPWNKNKWIEFCNPVKIKEYLALGKPVVSTYYPEIEPYSDIVYVARSYEQFISYISVAIEENNVGLKLARRKRVKFETWDSKVEQIKAFIDKGLDSPGNQVAPE